MIMMLIIFVALTLFIAAGTSIWSTATKTERKTFLKLIGKSALFSAIAIVILSVVVTLF